MKPIDETNNANEHNMVKNPKRQRQTSWLFTSVTKDVELGSTKKQLQLSGQGRTWTLELRISSPKP